MPKPKISRKPKKTYHRTHKTLKAADGHASNIKAGGGRVKRDKKDPKTIEYYYPDEE